MAIKLKAFLQTLVFLVLQAIHLFAAAPGTWRSTFIARIALPLLVWRTKIEDAMLQRDLPGHAAYAARVRYRLIPGIGEPVRLSLLPISC